jgi:hypothetical protein
MSRQTVSEMKRVLEMCHEQLRYAYQDYEDLLVIAMTGEGLDDLRSNGVHQATVRRIKSRSELKNVIQLQIGKRLKS